MTRARPLTLEVLPGCYAAVRLGSGDALPTWARPEAGPDGEPHRDTLLSITVTARELSIVCPERVVPANVPAQRGFVTLRVKGPLDFSEVGVLASLAGPLAKAGLSILAISTYETDYLLLREPDLERGLASLAAAGHTITRPAP